MIANDTSKMKARINALLAKAESSNFPEERDAFNAGAEKLMLRLGISIAELESEGKTKAEKVVEVRRTFTGDYSISWIPFVSSVARGFGHLTTLQAVNSWNSSRNSYIIGHESDVEMFLVLLDSLTLQVKSALLTWQKENREDRKWMTEHQRYLQNRSFIEGFGRKVGERLTGRRTTEEAATSTGTALVLVSKDVRVQDWISETYPTLGKSRGHDYSSTGYHAGQRSGATANLNDPSIGGSGTSIEK